MTANRMPVDAPSPIPDLVQRLAADSRRLARDEARLAKLELTENMKRAGGGVVLLAAAFGAGVVALALLTVFAIALISRVMGGHLWVGALVAGVVELAVAASLVATATRRGRAAA